MASSLPDPLLLPWTHNKLWAPSTPESIYFRTTFFFVWASGTLNFCLRAWNNHGGGRDPTVFGEKLPVKNTSTGRYEFLMALCLARISWFHHFFRSSSASILCSMVKWNYPFNNIHIYFDVVGVRLLIGTTCLSRNRPSTFPDLFVGSPDRISNPCCRIKGTIKVTVICWL